MPRMVDRAERLSLRVSNYGREDERDHGHNRTIDDQSTGVIPDTSVVHAQV